MSDKKKSKLTELAPELRESILSMLNSRSVRGAMRSNTSMYKAGQLVLQDREDDIDRKMDAKERKALSRLVLPQDALRIFREQYFMPITFLDDYLNWEQVLVSYIDGQFLTSSIVQEKVIRLFRHLAHQLYSLCTTKIYSSDPENQIVYDLSHQIRALVVAFCANVGKHSTVEECVVFQSLWPTLLPWSLDSMEKWVVFWKAKAERDNLVYEEYPKPVNVFNVEEMREYMGKEFVGGAQEIEQESRSKIMGLQNLLEQEEERQQQLAARMQLFEHAFGSQLVNQNEEEFVEEAEEEE